jgi:hypothetical protein
MEMAGIPFLETSFHIGGSGYFQHWGNSTTRGFAMARSTD